jgi:radial spoke head protein 4A
LIDKIKIFSFSKLIIKSLSSYDHLAKVISRLLSDRPSDAVDIFEDVSRLEKREKFFNKVDTIIDKPDKSTEAKLADIQRSLYIVIYN